MLPGPAPAPRPLCPPALIHPSDKGRGWPSHAHARPRSGKKRFGRAMCKNSPKKKVLAGACAAESESQDWGRSKQGWAGSARRGSAEALAPGAGASTPWPQASALPRCLPPRGGPAIATPSPALARTSVLLSHRSAPKSPAPQGHCHRTGRVPPSQGCVPREGSSPAQPLKAKQESEGKMAKTSHSFPAARFLGPTASLTPLLRRLPPCQGRGSRSAWGSPGWAPAPSGAALGRGAGGDASTCSSPRLYFCSWKALLPSKAFVFQLAPSLPAALHPPPSFTGISCCCCYYYYYYYYFELFLLASAKPGFPLEPSVEANLANVYF